ncbi:hypothetical protein MG293_010477 [Ovis ammon polii]|uniref:Uncharacterized protein n=1 Tax=Ovis ammon polii TaxID=230172 RepID=A0AAD4U7Q3_OVIAM|nr:hypothetical protein MG293_010477 [Ovis ammon polii]
MRGRGSRQRPCTTVWTVACEMGSEKRASNGPPAGYCYLRKWRLTAAQRVSNGFQLCVSTSGILRPERRSSGEPLRASLLLFAFRDAFAITGAFPPLGSASTMTQDLYSLENWWLNISLTSSLLHPGEEGVQENHKLIGEKWKRNCNLVQFLKYLVCLQMTACERTPSSGVPGGSRLYRTQISASKLSRDYPHPRSQDICEQESSLPFLVRLLEATGVIHTHLPSESVIIRQECFSRCACHNAPLGGEESVVVH